MAVLMMMRVNGVKKNMENNNKRKPRKYLQPGTDDEIREVPLWLLEDMIYCCVTTSGLYATDIEDIVKKIDNELWFRLDETSLRKKIEKYI